MIKVVVLSAVAAAATIAAVPVALMAPAQAQSVDFHVTPSRPDAYATPYP